MNRLLANAPSCPKSSGDAHDRDFDFRGRLRPVSALDAMRAAIAVATDDLRVMSSQTPVSVCQHKQSKLLGNLNEVQALVPA
jgi:hypothetical protein